MVGRRPRRLAAGAVQLVGHPSSPGPAGRTHPRAGCRGLARIGGAGGVRPARRHRTGAARARLAAHAMVSHPTAQLHRTWHLGGPAARRAQDACLVPHPHPARGQLARASGAARLAGARRSLGHLGRWSTHPGQPGRLAHPVERTAARDAAAGHARSAVGRAVCAAAGLLGRLVVRRPGGRGGQRMAGTQLPLPGTAAAHGLRGTAAHAGVVSPRMVTPQGAHVCLVGLQCAGVVHLMHAVRVRRDRAGRVDRVVCFCRRFFDHLGGGAGLHLRVRNGETRCSAFAHGDAAVCRCVDGVHPSTVVLGKKCTDPPAVHQCGRLRHRPSSFGMALVAQAKSGRHLHAVGLDRATGLGHPHSRKPVQPDKPGHVLFVPHQHHGAVPGPWCSCTP